MNRTHLLRRVKFRQSMILIWNLSILRLVRRKPGESVGVEGGSKYVKGKMNAVNVAFQVAEYRGLSKPLKTF
jgi:hypothetical protein